MYCCRRILCPKQRKDESGRAEFRDSGERGVDSVCLEPGLGDPKEQQQQRLLSDPGRFSSCSSGTNPFTGHQRAGYDGKGLHKLNKTKLNYFFLLNRPFPAFFAQHLQGGELPVQRAMSGAVVCPLGCWMENASAIRTSSCGKSLKGSETFSQVCKSNVVGLSCSGLNSCISAVL